MSPSLQLTATDLKIGRLTQKETGSFPKQCGNTWGSYGSSKKPGCLDRGAGEVLDGFHRYFRGFVPACSFRV